MRIALGCLLLLSITSGPANTIRRRPTFGHLGRMGSMVRRTMLSIGKRTD